jgi:predicted flap endonuclease-1-like 5' DNA nuclease
MELLVLAVLFAVMAFILWMWWREGGAHHDDDTQTAVTPSEAHEPAPIHRAIEEVAEAGHALEEEAEAAAMDAMDAMDAIEHSPTGIQRAAADIGAGASKAAHDAEDAVEAAADKVAEVAEEAESRVEAALSGEAPDDLTVIEGIGPVHSEMLHAAGITTFGQLAALSDDEIAAIFTGADQRHHASAGSWARQAKLAAAGDFEALRALQEHLIAGRDPDA